LLIIGQAPGIKVHKSGIPWNDVSGKELRRWLDMDSEQFYLDSRIAIVPMGFCYPGKGKSGDLPPRKECAPLWHEKVMAQMPDLKLTLLVGSYAQTYYLKSFKSLTENVLSYKTHLSQGFFPLPHPSPRNRLWLKRNPWFEQEVIVQLQKELKSLLPTGSI
jgi:uracil-DNA glycosylase